MNVHGRLFSKRNDYMLAKEQSDGDNSLNFFPSSGAFLIHITPWKLASSGFHEKNNIFYLPYTILRKKLNS